MFERGQRSFFIGAALAAFVVFGLAACSGDANTAPSDDTQTTVPPTTSVAPTTDSPSASSEVPPTDTVEPESDAATLPEAELESLGELSGLIAYRSEFGDMVTSTPDAAAQTVWADGDDFFSMQPTWARNGRVLAWSRSNQTSSAVVLANVGDPQAELQEVEVLPPPFYLSWSPGGENILGLRNGTQGLEAVVIDVISGATTSASLGQPFFTDWVSDESLVAAIGGRFLADIDAENLAPSLRETPNPLGVFESPIAIGDGTVIATTTDGRLNTIVEVEADGSVTELAHARGPVRMSLSPDGERLAVTVVASDQEVELISHSPLAQGNDIPNLENDRVSIVERTTRNVVTRPEADVLAVRWSPTGEHLAMLQRQTDQLRWLFADAATTSDHVPGVAFAPSREFAVSYLPFIDQYDRSSTWWSPDGRAFVFAGRAYDRDGIWVDRIDDDLGPAFLADGDIAFWSPE